MKIFNELQPRWHGTFRDIQTSKIVHVRKFPQFFEESITQGKVLDMAVFDDGPRLEEQIRQRIEETPRLKIIKLSEQPEYQNWPDELAAFFNDLLDEGTLNQYRKDWFYRPEEGVLGPLKPPEANILSALMVSYGQRIGYITGPTLYNRMGLTTQLPGTVVIASLGILEDLDIGSIKIKMTKSRVEHFSERDIPALQVLDALTDIDHIPGTPRDEALKLLKRRYQDLSLEMQQRVWQLADDYPEQTRLHLEQLSQPPQRGSEREA